MSGHFKGFPMTLHTLKLRDFRAHASTDLALGPGINLIEGPNGAGKTNILEAIHYLCLTKSFMAVRDRDVLRKGARFFEAVGAFESDQGRRLVVRAAFMPGEGKRIFVNGAALDRQAEIVGRLPVVVMEPGVSRLTMGGPKYRRQYLNNMLSQARPAYMEDLIRYRRTLRQRNELLGRYRGIGTDVLESLTSLLVELGTRVIAARKKFLGELAPFFKEACSHLRLDHQQPALNYVGLIRNDSQEAVPADIQQAFARALRDTAEREQALGLTRVGPHRDELVLKLNGQPLRRFASTGQHRAFGIALKLAQYLYLRHQTDESPILLLDDIFDSLDAPRIEAILELLQAAGTGQSVVTTTDATPYLARMSGAQATGLRVEEGRVTAPRQVP